MDDRLTEVEIKLAHLEAAHETLNNAVVEQQRQITALENQLALFKQHLREMYDSNIDPKHEKPPHY
ncbi:MAG TPA: SlyX family protein [Gammaproteobacteria bacterium]|jgi:SlyX protein